MRNDIRLICIGAVNLDDTFRLAGRYRATDSNPARCRSTVGGVAANVCRAANTLIPTALIGAIGADPAGAIVREQINTGCAAAALIELPALSTSRYVAILDQQGELVHGVADASITEQLRADQLIDRTRAFPPSCPLFVDANLSADTLARIRQQLRPAQPLYANTVSASKAIRLAAIADRIDCLFTNRLEAAALCRQPADSRAETLADALQDLGFKCFVMTDGRQPVLGVEQTARYWHTPETLYAPGNVNGAGDALTGAVIASLIMQIPLNDAIAEAGLPAALDQLRANDTQTAFQEDNS